MAQILMVSAEASPFASTGGLGDVLQGLPKALVKQGHKVAVALPLYSCVRDFHPEVIFHNLRFACANRMFLANVARIDCLGVQYLFLDLPNLFDRAGFYGEVDIDYPDNTIRFAAFSRGALGIAQHVFAPDIIHCHDWPSGVLPVFLAEHFQRQPALMGLKTIFTIHNLAYQGPISLPQAAGLNLNGTFKSADASMLRGALLHAHEVTTVSPTYADEICRPGQGCGLENVLVQRRGHLRGILNGIDPESWNPAADASLPAHFSREDLSGKSAVKRELLKEMGLSQDRMHRPLVGVVSRLAYQKGLDLLSQFPSQFMDLDVSLVLMGDGDPHQEDFFRWLAAANPTRVAVKIGFDRAQARRIIAGVDAFLMPSRYEPCGLTQMYAMRYGTLPIVHSTGGLKDTVSSATGFIFETHSWRALFHACREMNSAWGTTEWNDRQQSAMAADFSWDAAAGRYSELYEAMNHN